MADTAWRDLGVRIVSAAILTPAGLLVIWLGGLAWSIWLAVMAVGMATEWMALCGIQLISIAGAASFIVLLAAGGLASFQAPLLGLGVLVLGALLVSLWSRRLWLGFGILYIGAAYLSLLVLRTGPAGFRNVLFVMLVVWVGDVGAYVTGRWIGGPRLAPRISPGKTWSGAIGGTVAAMLTGLAAGLERPLTAAALALAISVMAQAGDLLESAVKRHFGAKDSGWIIPGHGGLLDRLDGVLAAAPAAMLWSLLTGPNLVLWH